MDNILDTELFDFIYNKILTLNNITAPEQNITKIIEYYINDVCTQITIKTNRNKFPKDLKYLAIGMINRAFNLYKSDTTSDNQNIQSMSETGRSVTFGETDNQKTKYQLLINQELKDNELLINRYRLLYKTRCSYEQN